MSLFLIQNLSTENASKVYNFKCSKSATIKVSHLDTLSKYAALCVFLTYQNLHDDAPYTQDVNNESFLKCSYVTHSTHWERRFVLSDVS